MMEEMNQPVVFEFQDAALYLKEVYKFRKRGEPGFSYDKWAGEMGFKSRAYLRALILGEKPLSESLLPNFLQGLKLTEEETEYFTLLIRYSIAPTLELRKIYGRQMIGIWKTKLQSVEVKDVAEFLSDPLIPALFTYLSFDDASSDMATLAKDFSCTEDRLQKALRSLIWTRLIDGRVGPEGQVQYQTIETHFRVPSLPGHSSLKNFHVEGLKLAQKAAEMEPANRKMYSCFIALNDKQFQEAQELIQDFNQKLLALFEQDQLGGKKIYRLNQQLFPLSEAVSSKRET
jgi:uncharacterized protein (TIGR02147 family)